MAPSGRSRGTTRATANHTTSNPARTSGGGGIAKRRNVKTDLDGDLDMDGSARRTAAATKGRNTNASRNTRGNAPARISINNLDAITKHLNGEDATKPSKSRSGKGSRLPLKWLRVEGVQRSKAASNDDGGIKNLVDFMERKVASMAHRPASKPVLIRQHRIDGNFIWIGAVDQDAEELQKLNGFTFAGADLNIEDLEIPAPILAGKSSSAIELEERLREILAERYVLDAKLLKLDMLAENEFIKMSGLMSTSDRADKMFRSLMKICGDLFKTRQAKIDAIESITVSGNGIANVSQIDCLATTFPDLKNLDLSNNQIATMRGLDFWKNKFQKLETLFISGNPIEAAVPTHIQTLLTWFPKLQNINGNIVRTLEEIKAAEEAARPKPIPQAGTDFRDEHGVAQAFLLDYFALYDTNREALAAKYYDSASTFSLAVDTVGPRDKNMAVLSWAPYLRLSRNLIKITTFSARIQRLFTGSNIIRQCWKTLPRTSHPNITTDINKYVVDCHPMPGLADPTGVSKVGVDGMIIILHGEFDEQEKETGNIGKRSFSRTFILGPGIPGANPIRVVSDMLSLRAYAPVPKVYEAPAAEQPGAPVAPVQAVTVDQQQVILDELCKQTRMTPVYAEMCLSDPNVNWDFSKGLALFNERRGNLPPDAFMA